MNEMTTSKANWIDVSENNKGYEKVFCIYLENIDEEFGDLSHAVIIMYRGNWVLKCHSLAIYKSLELSIQSDEDAKREALRIVKSKLEQLTKIIESYEIL